jgi:hypothetical protein
MGGKDGLLPFDLHKVTVRCCVLRVFIIKFLHLVYFYPKSKLQGGTFDGKGDNPHLKKGDVFVLPHFVNGVDEYLKKNKYPNFTVLTNEAVQVCG